MGYRERLDGTLFTQLDRTNWRGHGWQSTVADNADEGFSKHSRGALQGPCTVFVQKTYRSFDFSVFLRLLIDEHFYSFFAVVLNYAVALMSTRIFEKLSHRYTAAIVQYKAATIPSV